MDCHPRGGGFDFDRQREKSGETAFRVRINRTALRAATGTVRPTGVGMVAKFAEVDLLGDKRTVLQYTLSPTTEVSDRAFKDK